MLKGTIDVARRFLCNPSLGPHFAAKWLLSPSRSRLSQFYGRYGAKPDFLIIGTQKGGTTSLHACLAAHPRVHASAIKEIHYFDLHHDCSVDWYKAHFAPSWWLDLRGAQTGEASPYYLFDPNVAERVAKLFPGIKLIALLREPVSRAYSHYNMMVRQGKETHTFAKALELEAERLQRERDELGTHIAYTRGISHRDHSYASRGHYAEQLKAWFEHFPREQFLILESETFFADTARAYGEVQAFLGLPLCDLPSYRTVNDGEYQSMDLEMREQLAAYFAPHNAQLEALMGRPFWLGTSERGDVSSSGARSRKGSRYLEREPSSGRTIPSNPRRGDSVP